VLPGLGGGASAPVGLERSTCLPLPAPTLPAHGSLAEGDSDCFCGSEALPLGAYHLHPHKWKGYYAYYAKNIGAKDLLLKCDDDIVFISNLQPLLEFARADHAGKYLIYYPSIVNNDVSASFQAADGIITDPEYVLSVQASELEGPYSRRSISDWHNCSHCANFIHDRFLSAPEAFYTGCVHEWSAAARVSINFFVMRGLEVARVFGSYANESFIDEPYLTALMTERHQKPSAIVSDSVVVHFSFAFQHPDKAT